MIKMTAVKIGFYKGVLVRAGAHFDYDDSLLPLVPLPKWAVPFGTSVPEKAPRFGQAPALTMDDVRANAERRTRAGLADTKPLDAQLAGHRKLGTRPDEPVERIGFF